MSSRLTSLVLIVFMSGACSDHESSPRLQSVLSSTAGTTAASTSSTRAAARPAELGGCVATSTVDASRRSCSLRERTATLPWNAKILVVADSGESESYYATYVDSNRDGRFDPEDAGSFAPGSTIKVAVALAAIEANHGRAGIEKDLTAALVLSDNDAANRLIDAAGGLTTVSSTLEAKGLSPLIVGRYFGSERGHDRRCQEVNRPGNCASAAALVRSLRMVREPSGFDITPQDRLWLSQQLSSTPRELGFSEPDDHCRYIHRSGLQKCGISPFSPQEYSDVAYFPDLGLYTFVVVTPPSGVGETEAIKMITDLATQALTAFGH
jgi:beta-lactamase family protein